MDEVTRPQQFALFADHWSPRVVGELNGQHVKLAKFHGEFVWHRHEIEDELFLVIRGSFRMEFRDRSMTLREGEFLVVPRGVEHRPVADEEVENLAVSSQLPPSTPEAGGARTVTELERYEPPQQPREEPAHVLRWPASGRVPPRSCSAARNWLPRSRMEGPSASRARVAPRSRAFQEAASSGNS